MVDCFALFEEPRRPWLDADSLKQKFLARSAELHPDRVHGKSDAERQRAAQQFAELNAAYACLRVPRDRLRHLLELELGHKPTDLQEMTPAFSNLLMQVGAVCREADGFLSQQAALTSPILRAQSFPEIQDWMDRLQQLQTMIVDHQTQLLERLKTVDAAWMDTTEHKSLLPELERVSRGLGFFSRWNGQIQERLLRLTV